MCYQDNDVSLTKGDFFECKGVKFIMGNKEQEAAKNGGGTLRVDARGRVLRVPVSALKDHLPEGVLKKITTPDGRTVVPSEGTGRYSVPNALRRLQNAQQ